MNNVIAQLFGVIVRFDGGTYVYHNGKYMEVK